MMNKKTYSDAKVNGYYVVGQNNCELVRKQLDELGLSRYDRLPIGGVKFNWITRLTDINWQTFDSNFQIINHIYDEKHLSNKSLLLTNLRTHENQLQTSLKTFLPETYLLDNPTDRIRFKKAFRKDSLWICKPVGLSCGREIFLFRTEDELEQNLNEFHRNHYSTMYFNRLVQKYIANPLLIHRRKFDIRTYFLCICVANEILCFVAQTGYLRLSIYEFNLNDKNRLIHLTNQSVQIKDQEFASCQNSTGMTMEEFNEYFNRFVQPNMTENVDKDWVLKQLPEKLTEILRQVADSIRNKLVRRDGCFGFYGVDILIDEQLNCWLLEINSGPTLHMTNSALEKVIPLCLYEALSIVIECFNNYRSSNSIFPLRQSAIFKYIPSSNLPFPRSIISNSSFPMFSSFSNQHRIDLTPGAVIRSRRTSSRKSSIQPSRTTNRENLSNHLTEFIQSNK